MKTLARERDRSEILQRLEALRPDSPSRWGRMSAHQMVCHASDAFRMQMGEKNVRPVGGVLQRTVVKWIALYVPLKWPPGIPTVPETDQGLEGTRPVDWAHDVAKLERLIAVVGRRATEFHGRPHPVFGRLSSDAWLRCGYLHMDHHLRQFGV